MPKATRRRESWRRSKVTSTSYAIECCISSDASEQYLIWLLEILKCNWSEMKYGIPMWRKNNTTRYIHIIYTLPLLENRQYDYLPSAKIALTDRHRHTFTRKAPLMGDLWPKKTCSNQLSICKQQSRYYYWLNVYSWIKRSKKKTQTHTKNNKKANTNFCAYKMKIKKKIDTKNLLYYLLMY